MIRVQLTTFILLLALCIGMVSKHVFATPSGNADNGSELSTLASDLQTSTHIDNDTQDDVDEVAPFSLPDIHSKPVKVTCFSYQSAGYLQPNAPPLFKPPAYI